MRHNLTDDLRPATREADWWAVWNFFEGWHEVPQPTASWQPDLPDMDMPLSDDPAHPVAFWHCSIICTQSSGAASCGITRR